MLYLVRYHKDGNMNIIMPCLTVCVLAVLVFLQIHDKNWETRSHAKTHKNEAYLIDGGHNGRQ